MRIFHDDPSIHKNLSKAKNTSRCQGVLCQHDSCLENLGRAKVFSGVTYIASTTG